MKVLTLQLHRTPDGEAIKDGGPALASEIIKAFKRKGHTVDSISGNTMDESKQGKNLTPFFQRIYKAKAFAKEFDKKKFDEYDVIIFFHPSTMMGFKESDIPIKKTILFPTLLGKEYERFMSVPKKYIDLEDKILNWNYLIQCPSKAQAELLCKDYLIPAKRIFIKPRGYSLSIFPPLMRHLRNDISFKKPLILMSANAIRPQKGYIDLIKIVDYCVRKKMPIKIRIYADIIKSTNKLYFTYTQNFIKMIKNSGLGEYFEFLQAVDQKYLAIEMAKADLAIIPSIYETFGKSAIESSGSGLPTILFNDVPVYKEFLDKKSAIFCSRTPEDFYKELHKVISSSKKYNDLSLNGIVNGKKYILENLYDDLIETIKFKINFND